MLSRLALDGDRRGISEFRCLLPADPFRDAARQLIHRSYRILVLTGFFIPETLCCETDGPPGAVALGRALEKMGRTVMYVVDTYTEPLIRVLAEHARIELFPVTTSRLSEITAREILEGFSPDTVISVERPGPSENGRMYTIHGHDITDSSARLEYLFQEPLLRIGIGDGGNELGMGRLADRMPVHRRACVVPADHTLIGATSNAAAYSLVAALEITAHREDLLPTTDQAAADLLALRTAGAVDGITHLNEPTVDGFSLDTILNALDRLRTMSRSIQAADTVIREFARRQEDQYGVFTGKLTTRYDLNDRQVRIQGTLLLPEQVEQLRTRMKDREIPVSTAITVLSDPDQSAPFCTPARPEVAMTDSPGGRMTTQFLASDRYARVMWHHENWLLIQTPDLAMGWVTFTAVDYEDTDAPAGVWQNLRRSAPGRQVPIPVPVRHVLRAAADCLGVPYRLGARSGSELDCSGFIQMVFNRFGLLLPRNSRVQRRQGIRIRLDATRPGDLLFAAGRAVKRHHVALVAEDDTVIHACLSAGKVIQQPRRDFEVAYSPAGARRIVQYLDGKERN